MPSTTKPPAAAQAQQTVTSVSTPIRELGLCTTCKHQNCCLFVKAARQPIWFCEEFDDSGQAGTVQQAKQHARGSNTNYGEAQSEGLCEDCQERQECAKHKPGQAITDCADYR